MQGLRSTDDNVTICGEDNDMGEGAWFGEACLFASDQTREFSVLAVVDSELAVLESASYHSIASKYPRVLHRHEQIAARILEGSLDVDMLAYKRLVRTSDLLGQGRLISSLRSTFFLPTFTAIVPE